MSTKIELWYCEERDYWTDDPDEYAATVADEAGQDVTLTFRKGEQVKLRDHIKAEHVIEHLDNMEDLCGLEWGVCPTSSIPKEKIDELDRFLQQWCDSIDYPFWQDDWDGEEITREAKPTESGK